MLVFGKSNEPAIILHPATTNHHLWITARFQQLDRKSPIILKLFLKEQQTHDLSNKRPFNLKTR